MTMFKKTLLAGLVAGAMASGHVLAANDSNSFSELQDGGSVKTTAGQQQAVRSQAQPSSSDSKYPIVIGDDINGELSQEEMDLINRKRHVLMKYLYEQEQLDALRQMLDEEGREKAYNETLRERVPLTPGEIVELRKMAQDAKRAENAPLANSPVDMGIRTIDLDVDAPKPIVLNVATGYASSIVFYDQSGSPWPIDGDIIGDELAFGSKQISKDRHIAVFEIKQAFSESNALINLEGLSVPIVVRLVGHEGKVDSRLSVRIPKFGPGAQFQPFVHQELENASQDMLKVLNGDRLADAKRFELHGVPGEVTYKGGSIYIRTRANLISPPWRSSVVSPTGYKVYELPPVTNLLFSIDGEMRDATIEKGFEVKLTQKSSIFTE